MEQSLENPATSATERSQPQPLTAPTVWVGPLRAAIAERLFRSAIAKLPLIVRYPDGRVEGAGHGRSPVMILHDPRAFFLRLGASRLIGFGESYQQGEWDSDQLAELLAVSP